MRTLLVGLGGFVGSVLRYWLSGVAQGLAPRSSFPIGTLLVNVSGCFVIGVLAQLVEERGAFAPDTRALLFVGVLGGYTTFSAFANETVSSARDGSMLAAALNVVLTVAGCLIAVWAGRAAVTMAWR